MSTLTREQVFDQLAALGLASVRMSFYGGHDEGDVEDVKYLDASGQALDVEIDERSDLYDALCHPVLGPAAYTLHALVKAVDENSDGWAYWRQPARAAQRPMVLIGTTRDYLDDRGRADATPERLKQAYTPLRAFKTRSGLQFQIYDPAD